MERTAATVAVVGLVVATGCVSVGIFGLANLGGGGNADANANATTTVETVDCGDADRVRAWELREMNRSAAMEVPDHRRVSYGNLSRDLRESVDRGLDGERLVVRGDDPEPPVVGYVVERAGTFHGWVLVVDSTDCPGTVTVSG